MALCVRQFRTWLLFWHALNVALSVFQRKRGVASISSAIISIDHSVPPPMPAAIAGESSLIERRIFRVVVPD